MENWTWLTPTGASRRLYHGSKSRSTIFLECACKCGKVVWIRKNNYETRKARSCGCYKAARMVQVGRSTSGRGRHGGTSKAAEVGNKTHYGRLMVLEVIPDNGPVRKRKWICICKCGTPVIVTAERLAYGHTKSCGCGAVDYFNRLLKLTEARRETAIDHARETSRKAADVVAAYPWVASCKWLAPPSREQDEE